MNSIRDELVALDTNEFVFALRREARRTACEDLFLKGLPALRIYVPLQILVELQHNLSQDEMRDALIGLTRARSVTWDYAPAQPEIVERWQQRGAKKGDAMIVAHLEADGIRYLISENRHFLAELSNLPFTVLTSEQVLSLLD